MSAHTPTPWQRGERLTIWGNDTKIAACLAASIDNPTAKEEANAAFILRAVNAHDALVLAAREAAVVIADVLTASGQSRLSSPVLVHLLNALDVADGKQREPLVPFAKAGAQ